MVETLVNNHDMDFTLSRQQIRDSMKRKAIDEICACPMKLIQMNKME